MPACRSYSDHVNKSFATTQVERIMKDQKFQKQKPAPDNRDIDDEGRPNTPTENGGVRQYEGGRNPDMQSQRSNRQGSGVPTQQRTEDR